MKRFLLICLCAFLVAPAYAQLTNINNDVGAPLRTSTGYSNIEGTPYLIADWLKGTIVTKEGQKYENVPLRYNVYKDMLEYQENNSAFELDNEYVKSFSMTSFNAENTTLVYEFRNGFNGVASYSNEDYFRVLYDGKVKLLQKFVARVEEPSSNSYGATDLATKKFVTSNKYWLVQPNGQAVSFRRNKGSLNKAFPGAKGKLKAYFKENRPDLDNDTDLANVLAFIEANM